MFEGKKTYIAAAVLAVLGAARGFGLVTPEQAAILEPILLGAGLAALRAAK
jgi:hypothetical protein